MPLWLLEYSLRWHLKSYDIDFRRWYKKTSGTSFIHRARNQKKRVVPRPAFTLGLTLFSQYGALLPARWMVVT